MSAINVTQVQVLDNPQMFSNPLQFEIQYECLQDLQNDLEWKLTYVGSAESDKHDQVLDTVCVGPVMQGSFKFVFQANPPDVSKIPESDILGVTVLLLTCSYNQKEFIRVGYYVNNEYADEELRENPPEQPRVDRVVRNILAEKPRVTRFPCEFDTPAIPAVPATPQVEVAPGYAHMEETPEMAQAQHAEYLKQQQMAQAAAGGGGWGIHGQENVAPHMQQPMW